MQEHNRWHSDAVPRGAQHGKTLLKVWWNLRRRVELWLWKSRTSDRGRLVPSVHGVAWTTWAAGLDHGKAGAVVDNIQAWATDLAYASLRGNRIRWHLCTNSVSWRSQRRECFMFPWPPVGGLSLPNCSGKSFASYRVLSKSSGTKHASNHGCKCWENRASCGFSGVGTHWTSESSHWCTPPAFFSAALMRRFPFCSPGRIRGTHVLLPLYHGSRFERVEKSDKRMLLKWHCVVKLPYTAVVQEKMAMVFQCPSKRHVLFASVRRTEWRLRLMSSKATFKIFNQWIDAFEKIKEVRPAKQRHNFTT